MNITILIIGGLAVWRLSHAIVKENGPLMCLARLRAYLARHQKRSGGLFDMVSCTMCVSFWIALVAALWVSHDVFHWLGYGLALSGVSLLLEHIFIQEPDSLTVVTTPAPKSITRRTVPEGLMTVED